MEEIGGFWTGQETLLHINVLELMAVERTLAHFLDIIQGKTVLVSVDNSTAVAYLKRQGGTRSNQLMAVTYRIFRMMEDHHVTLVCRHIPGRLNVHADRLSRQGQILPTEWSLHPRVVRGLWAVWDTPHVDLFATRCNYQLPCYVSPIPDGQAMAVDALSISWAGMFVYAFPPTAILSQVLTKVLEDRCSMILIAPLWPKQSWFPALLDLLIDTPRVLPLLPRLLKQPQSSIYHENPQVYHLHAWRLSPSVSERKAFLSRLRIEWRDLRRNLVLSSTSLSGMDSQVGVVQGVRILSMPL
jgi:hypothetical protein